MQPRLALGAVLALLIIAVAACGDDDSPIDEGMSDTGTVSTTAAADPIGTALPRAPSPSLSPTPERPAPVIDVVFVSVDPSATLLRFAAFVHNPSDRTIEGMRLRWEATDAGGALVGSFQIPAPAIGAGQTFTYVGGAGSAFLTGTPVAVKVVVADPGRLSDAPPTFFSVENVQVMRHQSALSGKTEYTVTADVTTGAQPVRRTDLAIMVVLKDAAGTIVGADFDPLPLSLPEIIQPGTKFKAQVRSIPATTEPVTAELISYARAP